MLPVCGRRAHACWRCVSVGIRVDWNFAKVKLTTALVMQLAIGVALKHAENAINSFITYNKSNSACGMTDDQSNGPTKDASYSSIIMKTPKISYWNQPNWRFDEFVIEARKKACKSCSHPVTFYHFSLSFIEMDDMNVNKQILKFRICIHLKDCLICILSAKKFYSFLIYTFHSVHFNKNKQTHKPDHCNNGRTKNIHKHNGQWPLAARHWQIVVIFCKCHKIRCLRSRSLANVHI